MIAVSTGRRCCRDPNCSKTIVLTNDRDEIVLLTSVFQYAAAFLDRSDVSRFVLGMRLSGHEFLVQAGYRQPPTACTGRFRRRIRLENWITAWPRTYGPETDMPFVCMKE